MNRIHDVVMTF